MNRWMRLGVLLLVGLGGCAVGDVAGPTGQTGPERGIATATTTAEVANADSLTDEQLDAALRSETATIAGARLAKADPPIFGRTTISRWDERLSGKISLQIELLRGGGFI